MATAITYESDTEPEAEVGQPPSKKRRRANREYYLDKAFTNQTVALQLIESENCWAKYGKFTSTKEGDKQFYRCSKAKQRGQQCSAAIYLLYHEDSLSVSVFRTEAEHDHVEEANGILDDVQNLIKQIYNGGVTKPNHILRQIRRIAPER